MARPKSESPLTQPFMTRLYPHTVQVLKAMDFTTGNLGYREVVERLINSVLRNDPVLGESIRQAVAAVSPENPHIIGVGPVMPSTPQPPKERTRKVVTSHFEKGKPVDLIAYSGREKYHLAEHVDGKWLAVCRTPGNDADYKIVHHGDPESVECKRCRKVHKHLYPKDFPQV